MNIPESQDTHKPTDGQENPSNISNHTPYEFDKFTVRRKGRDWEVRLKHEFIEAWASILHPLTFVVYCCLEMCADWRPGANHGHTGGYGTRRDLMKLTGTDDKGLRRALRELATYRIIEYAYPDPAERMKRGKPVDIILDQRVKPPGQAYRMSHNELTAAAATVGPSTLRQNALGTLGQNAGGTLGQNAGGTLGQNAGGSPGQNAGGSVSIATDSKPNASSARDLTTPLQVSRTTTTTTQPKTPDLTPLREAIPWIVDDTGLLRLWNTAREQAPDVTVCEVAEVVRCKLKIINNKSVKSPVAYLMVAVPSALSGQGLSQYRAWFGAANRVIGGNGPNFA